MRRVKTRRTFTIFTILWVSKIMEEPLDEYDRLILQQLERDARKAYSAIADD